MTKRALVEVLSGIGAISSDGIVLFDVRKQTLEYVNASAMRIFDISHESFRLEPAFFVNHIIEEDLRYLQAEMDRLKEEKQVENIEFRTQWHDGSIQNVSVSCYVVSDGKYIVGFLKNITASREHENYIINYGAKKNTLLDMITHNLSGPLAVAKNLSESMGHAFREKDLRNLETHILLIADNTKHCLDIVSEFLEEEHFVSEEIYVKVNRFNVLEKLQTIIERMEKAFPEFKFRVQMKTDKLYINSDDVKFLQIMNNLISNAIKWSPAGNPIDIVVEAPGNDIRITVTDYGIGIPDDLKNFIFHRYTPASRPGLKGERSIGMGLYIVRKLALLLQGNISFVSEEGKGSSFTLTLPREIDSTSHHDQREESFQRRR